MKKKNTVFIGFGDLACRTAKQLASAQVGICRSVKAVPDHLHLMLGDVSSSEVLQYLSTHYFDDAVITLTPTARSDEGYQQGYVAPMEQLLEVWQRNAPGNIVFVSSTGVYAQNEGEWVDETSACQPTEYSGRRLLEAEALLRASGLAHCVLRLAGIYGPGRDFLQRAVAAGEGGSLAITNRIHADDAARFIAHVIDNENTKSAEIFNVCDSAPVPGWEVRSWLAGQIGYGAEHLRIGGRTRGGNKRCSNKRMLATGFQLKYPSYVEGYSELIGASKKPF